MDERSPKPHRLGLVFVHGLQGTPAQFDFLRANLPPDVAVCSVTLPGHGADTKAFRRADEKQWLDSVSEACRCMHEKCGQVIFVGHSMGCLLGMMVQKEHPLFSGMLLLCCPFSVRPTVRYLRLGFLAACTRRQDPPVKAAREANGVYARHKLAYLTCIRPYMALFRLMKAAKALTPPLPEQTLFCFSRRDEIVSPKSRYYAENTLHAQTELLPDCGHNYFTQQAKARLTELLLNMLADV